MIRSKQLLVLSVLATHFVSSDASIRGANAIEGENDERELYYYYRYGRYNNRNRNYYYQQRNNNNNQNNYYANKNNNNQGGGQGNYYRNRNQNKYYAYDNQNDNNANGDDGNNANGDDGNNAADDLYGGVNDDKWGNYNDDDSLSAKISNYEKQAEETFSEWYQTPPGEWSGAEWGLLVTTIFATCAVLACLYNCFRCCCCGSRKSVDHNNFDGYVGMSTKSSGLLSSRSESTCGTDVDDDATFDQVMRLRSID